jgi:DNA excision repair protein ERCC-3
MKGMKYDIPQIMDTTYKDYTNSKLKQDHSAKALFCGQNGEIFLETSSKYYKEISDFLVAIADPVYRTKNIHEFCLTRYSLYAAASMNIKTEDIISTLNNLSKNELPMELISYIKEATENCGKARLILNNKRYFIECKDRNILAKIQNLQKVYLSYSSIVEKRKMLMMNKNNEIQQGPIKIQNENIISVTDTSIEESVRKIMAGKTIIDDSDTKPSKGEDYFEIDPEDIEEVKKICIEEKYPLLEEYDFKNDKSLPPLEIYPKLKSPTRGYQEKALGIMFSNQRARSGIIVLPCGAGKTLVGILAVCTIKKNTMILCNSSLSVLQWYEEINNWTKVNKCNVARMTSKTKDPLWNFEKEGGILIVSYFMMSYTGKREKESEEMINRITNTEWGLMILDEVQVVPAKMFKKIISTVKSHCKLGLTATLVREDEKIKDLNYLIGPKHYEANWLDLQRDGYLARVKCVEILCEMSKEFYEEYLKVEDDKVKQRLLYVNNPNKFYICKALIAKHAGDKILIFSDSLEVLDAYAKELNYPCIQGNVSDKKRHELLNQFRDESPKGKNVLLISKIGDTSIDLPNAKVIIQISSHFGSRRQEAQRLGRILRPKKDLISEYNAFFYTLVTKNTKEMGFSIKRHGFLVDQGYYFKVVTNIKKDLGIEPITDNYEYSNKMLKAYLANKDQYKERKEKQEDEDFIDDDIFKIND